MKVSGADLKILTDFQVSPFVGLHIPQPPLYAIAGRAVT